MNVVEKEKALLGRKNRNSEGYYIEREDLQIMKCVGIIGAMEQEVARLKEVMENVSITTRAGMDFYEGILEGKKVVVVQSGIGKVIAGISYFPQMFFIMIWMQQDLDIRRDRFRR